jgi:hypothetical protein
MRRISRKLLWTVEEECEGRRENDVLSSVTFLGRELLHNLRRA